VDGISDCRRYGVTVIAFVGSVFSPYYHFAGRKDPENHVCINVALYSVDGHRWAMTERSRKALARDADFFRVGASELRWDGDALTIHFNEMSLPRPPAQWRAIPINGEIRLKPIITNERSFDLDLARRHQWRPIAPLAEISLASDHYQDGGWRGEGYLDSNSGTEPLEDGFERWDWARGASSNGDGIVLYNALCRDGTEKRMGLRFNPAGGHQEFDPPASHPLKRGFWGVKRRIPCDDNSAPSTLLPLEDSPFYTRSMVENHLGGERLVMMHETFSGKRLSSNFVRLMLPVRMPRRRKWPI